MTTTEQAVEIARAYMAKDAHLADPQTAWGKCVIESEALASHLEAHDVIAYRVRITGANYPGREHWALLLPEVPGDEPEDVCDGILLDPTARQFGADLPHPYVSDMFTWLDDMAEGMVDALQVQLFTDDPNNLDIDVANYALWDVYARDDIEPGDLIYPWQDRPTNPRITAAIDRAAEVERLLARGTGLADLPGLLTPRAL